MCKKVLLILVLTSLWHLQTCFSQGNECNLTLQITKIRSNKGKILLQLYDAKKALIFSASEPIDEHQCLFPISQLKSGKYAIRYFHDENGNGILDTNWLGIPTEGYGFSNNAVSMFGAPPFEDRLFTAYSHQTIALTIKY